MAWGIRRAERYRIEPGPENPIELFAVFDRQTGETVAWVRNEYIAEQIAAMYQLLQGVLMWPHEFAPHLPKPEVVELPTELVPPPGWRDLLRQVRDALTDLGSKQAIVSDDYESGRVTIRRDVVNRALELRGLIHQALGEPSDG